MLLAKMDPYNGFLQFLALAIVVVLMNAACSQAASQFTLVKSLPQLSSSQVYDGPIVAGSIEISVAVYSDRTSLYAYTSGDGGATFGGPATTIYTAAAGKYLYHPSLVGSTSDGDHQNTFLACVIESGKLLRFYYEHEWIAEPEFTSPISGAKVTSCALSEGPGQKWIMQVGIFDPSAESVIIWTYERNVVGAPNWSALGHLTNAYDAFTNFAGEPANFDVRLRCDNSLNCVREVNERGRRPSTDNLYILGAVVHQGARYGSGLTGVLGDDHAGAIYFGNDLANSGWKLRCPSFQPLAVAFDTMNHQSAVPADLTCPSLGTFSASSGTAEEEFLVHLSSERHFAAKTITFVSFVAQWNPATSSLAHFGISWFQSNDDGVTWSSKVDIPNPFQTTGFVRTFTSLGFTGTHWILSVATDKEAAIYSMPHSLGANRMTPFAPSTLPTVPPSAETTLQPTLEPTLQPTLQPTLEPTLQPTLQPTNQPTLATLQPTSATPQPTPATGAPGSTTQSPTSVNEPTIQPTPTNTSLRPSPSPSAGPNNGANDGALSEVTKNILVGLGAFVAIVAIVAIANAVIFAFRFGDNMRGLEVAHAQAAPPVQQHEALVPKGW